MQGARFGVIRHINYAKRIVSVRMNHPQVKTLQRFPFDDIQDVNRRFRFRGAR